MVPAAVAEVVRTAAARVVGTLFRMTGDLVIAEDAFVDAAFAAFETWPTDGVPTDPDRWLTLHARRAAFVRGTDSPLAAGPGWEAIGTALVTQPDPPPAEVVDADVLRLLLTCCDPGLALDARVGLLLRLVSGLTTAEIARAFTTDLDTVADRADGATAELTARGVGVGPPADAEAVRAAIPGMLAAVHLVFSTGNQATEAQRIARVDLTDEGIRLARMVCAVLPDEPEPRGLLALLLAVHARRATRVDAGGTPVLFADVSDADRTRWDAAAVAEARRLLDQPASDGPNRPDGPYRLQARIALAHSSAPTAAATDWPAIVGWYRELAALGASPFVQVNHALAEAKVAGPAAGLAVLDAAVGVGGWRLYHAARADLLERAGRPRDAAEALRSALAREPNTVDRRLLEGRLAALGGPGD